jgi:hypothetical protein
MEQSCHKCGAKVGGEQAFCPRCGAVVGMSDAGHSQGGEWDMASTMVGKKLPQTPQQRPPAPPQPPQTPPPPRHAAAAPQGSYAPQAAPAQATTRGISASLIAVIGFAAVLIIGGLLIFLFYLNSQG